MIKEAHDGGQPVLVGTTSVEASELISKMLKRANIAHSVLNAKYHEQEADIVARAGIKGAVTIATNMAGRGTDIKLGEGVTELGGLFVLGTERHESRRIDNQLRGRCSRQGDPGVSQFVVSLEDDLMRLFANAGPVSAILDKTFSEGDELEHPLLNHSIASAQKKVEEQNYLVRKRLLQYDDVLNKQREVVYGLRNDAIISEEPKGIIVEMLDEELDFRLQEIEAHTNKNRNKTSQEDADGFLKWINIHFPVAIKPEEIHEKVVEDLKALSLDRIKKAYEAKESVEAPEDLVFLERYGIIRAIDKNWQVHLTEMDELRRSVGLRSYGQKDPLSEYKSEAYVYFEELMNQIRAEVCTSLFRSATNMANFQHMLTRLSVKVKESGPSDLSGDASPRNKKSRPLPKVAPKIEAVSKVGRNDPCPCGSGKKYKKCCGV